MNRGKLALALISGLLLGLSFPPIPFGLLALIALIPFLLLLDRLDRYSDVMRYSYLAFLLFNVVTLYWVGGFTHGNDKFLMLAGAALIVVHPVFFLVPTFAYVFVKRNLGNSVALIAMPFIWVSFEWLHSLGEIGFPWLSLGNTQTYAIERAQFITYTGVLGLSFWIVAVNALVYYLYRKLILDDWKIISRRFAFSLVVLIVIVLLPGIHGRAVLSSSSSGNPVAHVRVGILQPNIDPWKKWETGPDEQLRSYMRLSAVFEKENPDLIIWPETAISFRILSGRFSGLFEDLRRDVDSLRSALLTGFADIVFYEPGKAPVGSKMLEGRSIHYDDFNAIMLLKPGHEEIQKYAKMKLVPFGERVPYAETLSFLVQAVKWNVGISGWGIGQDTTVFFLSRGDSVVKFSAMVCYESIYPDLVSSFVRRGAEFLVVITNDSWYGNTSGPYQHARYAIFRAIENRRSIARCANGGISSLIDPYGRVLDSRGMFRQASIVGDVSLSSERTFYSTHGDFFPRVCTAVGSLFLAVAVVRRFRARKSVGDQK